MNEEFRKMASVVGAALAAMWIKEQVGESHREARNRSTQISESELPQPTPRHQDIPSPGDHVTR